MLKGLAKGSRQLTLIKGIDEETSQDSAAAFVTKNIAKGWRIADNTLTIIETRVGAGAENTSYASFFSAEGTCSAKQITIHLNISYLKSLIQQSPHSRYVRFSTASTIEENLGDG